MEDPRERPPSHLKPLRPFLPNLQYCFARHEDGDIVIIAPDAAHPDSPLLPGVGAPEPHPPSSGPAFS